MRCLSFLIVGLLSVSSSLFGNEPLRVVALHSVLAEFAVELGGSDVQVICPVPGGVDPHGFNPAPADIRALAKAELVLASGFGLEPWLERLISSSGTKATLLEVSSVISNPVRSCEGHDHAEHEGHDHGELDPHWWHSLIAAREVTAAVASRLCALRPEQAGAIRARQAAYEGRLTALAGWVEQQLKDLPLERRLLVTSHDAFGYLARDYGFRIFPLHGVNPGAEPDAKELAELIVFIRKEKIRAVFADNTENSRVFEAMLKESGARLGAVLYADGLGLRESPAASYEGMIRTNIQAILGALHP